MIPPEVVVIPALVGIPAAVVFARMWFRHQERMAGLRDDEKKRADGQERVSGAERDSIEERLTRIEQAVDAIAVEVERMGEGQRFVTRLLAERDAPALGAGAGADAANRDDRH